MEGISSFLREERGVGNQTIAPGGKPSPQQQPLASVFLCCLTLIFQSASLAIILPPRTEGASMGKQHKSKETVLHVGWRNQDFTDCQSLLLLFQQRVLGTEDQMRP